MPYICPGHRSGVQVGDLIEYVSVFCKFYTFNTMLQFVNFQAENLTNCYQINEETLRKGCIGLTRIKLTVLRAMPSTVEPTESESNIYETPVCFYSIVH